jgi:hypothetical protein
MSGEKMSSRPRITLRGRRLLTKAQTMRNSSMGRSMILKGWNDLELEARPESAIDNCEFNGG